ncbi:uncharacterized protein Dwil_GK19191 [Drosophila willistoni]|uniref:H15 domain-containing protein n=1 Tax=Drosophila willistoni TaxID=7260 RepID=B4N9U6_DROWI|nr:uncharacterized protein LOC6647087 [Drosophila willistoni]EDW80661.1 uncharacterized protein Dwil_GK19191 [Drosophila willistoni]
MALIYHDRTIRNSYELVMAALGEISHAATIQEVGRLVSIKTDFPAAVCHKIIKEALEEGLVNKTIRQIGELYYAVPPKPPKLKSKPRVKAEPQPKPKAKRNPK